MARRVTLTLVATAALGVLGAGFAPTALAQIQPAPERTLSVTATAKRPVPPKATEAQKDAAYREALIDAAARALDKARLLAQLTGVSVGAVHTVAESSDAEPVCASEPVAVAGGRPERRAARRGQRRRTTRARRADAPPVQQPTECAMVANLQVTYAIS